MGDENINEWNSEDENNITYFEWAMQQFLDEDSSAEDIIDEDTIQDFEWARDELLAIDIDKSRDEILDIIPELEIHLNSIIPDFRCSPARNGIVQIKINNFKKLCKFKHILPYDQWPYSSFFSTASMFRIGCTFHQNGISCIMDIERGYLYEGELFIKFPTYYTSYNVDIWLQSNSDIQSYSELPNKYSFVWPKSDIQTIHIPAFLSYDEYQINETIGISPKLEEYGKITAILSDNTYQINYDSIDGQRETNIPISRIYPKRAYKVLNLGRVLNKDIYKNVYIERNNKSEYETVVDGLWNYFECNRRCGEALEDVPFPDYVQSLEYFLIWNICEFLFESEYNYHVDCIINGLDGTLRFGNIVNTRPEFIGVEYLMHHCDCCGVELNNYDFVFSCNAPQKQHLLCTDCINTTIESHQQLKPLIHSILSEKLNVDCIGKIIEFVIGRIIHKQ